MNKLKEFNVYEPHVSVAYSEYEKNISERNKITAELNELNTSFFKKPGFYISIVSTLIPSILAIIAFYGTNAGDFFDNKIKEIQLEKRELQIDISNLESEKEKLEQNKELLEGKYIKRTNELDDKFIAKEKKLEASISRKVSELEATVQLKNEALTKKLVELDGSKESEAELKTSFRLSIEDNKRKNELIINLNRIIEEEKSTKLNLTSQNKDFKQNEEALDLSIELLRKKSIKDSVIIFLISRGWSQAGFIRIRDGLNQSESYSVTISQIKKSLKGYPEIFKEVKFKGEKDIEGVEIRKDVSTSILIM
jgi:hypothetical protein